LNSKFIKKLIINSLDAFCKLITSKFEDLQAGGHWFESSRAHISKDKASEKSGAFLFLLGYNIGTTFFSDLNSAYNYSSITSDLDESFVIPQKAVLSIVKISFVLF